MATWQDVAKIAIALPQCVEGTTFGNRAWKVANKPFVWARPLGRTDLVKLGDAAPHGEIMAARTESFEMKAAMLASGEPAFFTIAHFDNYAIVLVLIERLTVKALRGVIEDAWLSQAPLALAVRKRG